MQPPKASRLLRLTWRAKVLPYSRPDYTPALKRHCPRLSPIIRMPTPYALFKVFIGWLFRLPNGGGGNIIAPPPFQKEHEPDGFRRATHPPPPPPVLWPL